MKYRSRFAFVKGRGILRKQWASVVGQKTSKTVSFVHISTEREKCFAKDTFIHPEMVTSFFRHSLNPPDGCLNLSQYVLGHISDWVKFSQTTKNNHWKSGTKHLFHIDLRK